VKRIQIARRKPQRTIERQRIKLAEQAATIKLLQDEFGSLLDLVPLVDFTEGADEETLKWVMGGTFLPHIAQLMASTLLAFGAQNVCEWHLLGDPRGEFVLHIQRKEGKSAAELRDEARDKARLIETRFAELIREIRPSFDAYMDSTGTLEQLLDVIFRGMQAAERPLGMAIADINAAAWNRLRRDSLDYFGLAPELLPNIVGGLLDERRAARSILDRQEIKASLLPAPHFGDLYRAYLQARGVYDHTIPNSHQAAAQSEEAEAGGRSPGADPAQAGS
jgi:hypothetical protein